MKFRQATREDLPAIVHMLVDDPLGKRREVYSEPLKEAYYEAFESINKDENQELIVVEREGEVIGTLQLTFIRNLTFNGGLRAQVEGVRIRRDKRNQGYGEQLFKWVIEKAKKRGAHILQLTTDKKRPDAIRFYKRIGLSQSHEGMKVGLE